MLIIKAFNKGFEDWGNDVDDFFISYQIDIGQEEVQHESYLYTIDVVSPKRLQNMIAEGDAKFGRGYLILTDFNEKVVKSRVENLLKNCQSDDATKAYYSLSRYFRWEMDE